MTDATQAVSGRRNAGQALRWRTFMDKRKNP